MKTRFEGPDGRRLLVEVLQEQQLVQHDSRLADRLADDGELVEFGPGEALVEQGSADNDVYFIIDGEASVVVNRRTVATRTSRDSVGEMALVDGSARRSASVVATRPICALRVAEARFQKIALDYPRVWRSIAVVVAQRLRERIQFHRPPNDKPILFLGSSVEGLPVAKQLQLGLKHAPFTAQPWTSGVFGAGGVSIDSLLAHVDRADFAVFAFGPDDQVTSRSEAYLAPRDNVVFELGLYMGRLSRDRCYIVKEHSSDIKIPSDLLGVTMLTYVHATGDDLGIALGPVCTQLEDVIRRLGVK